MNFRNILRDKKVVNVETLLEKLDELKTQDEIDEIEAKIYSEDCLKLKAKLQKGYVV